MRACVRACVRVLDSLLHSGHVLRARVVGANGIAAWTPLRRFASLVGGGCLSKSEKERDRNVLQDMRVGDNINADSFIS